MAWWRLQRYLIKRSLCVGSFACKLCISSFQTCKTALAGNRTRAPPRGRRGFYHWTTNANIFLHRESNPGRLGENQESWPLDHVGADSHFFVDLRRFFVVLVCHDTAARNFLPLIQYFSFSAFFCVDFHKRIMLSEENSSRAITPIGLNKISKYNRMWINKLILPDKLWHSNWMWRNKLIVDGALLRYLR